MRLLSVGDRVGEGRFDVHSRFDRVVNLVAGERLVAVVAPDVGGGPINLVLDEFDLDQVRRVDIDRDSIGIADRRLRRGDVIRYDSTLPAGNAAPAAVAANVAVCEQALVAGAPPGSMAFLLGEERASGFRPGFEQATADRLRRGVEALFGGALTEGIATLRGTGFGLTPAGDDFIAGNLVALNVLRDLHGADLSGVIDQVHRSARSGSLLVNAFLDLAAAGLVPEAMRDLVRALLGDGCDVPAALDRVMAVGQTSGADFATGLLMTLRAGVESFPIPVGRR